MISLKVLQSAMLGPMDITVSTTVVVTVVMTLNVTNRQVSVTRDVIQDIQILTVKAVCLKFDLLFVQ